MEWLKSLLIAIGLALVIRWAFAEPFRIPSGSMEPTFHGDPRFLRGDRVFVNKLVYGLRCPLNGVRIPFTRFRLNYAKTRLFHWKEPQRWDIVVFKSVEDFALHTTLVKRVVGLPGERVHIADGKVYINGEPLELPPSMPPVYYTSPGPFDRGSDMKYGILPDTAHAVVPEDSYLLLGDNSAHSRDGRFFGWVSNERILGRASCVWWPIPRWRDFTGFSQTWPWRLSVALVLALIAVRVFFGQSWGVHVQAPGGRAKVNHVYVNRWAYGLPLPFSSLRVAPWGAPRRGDLVVYRAGRSKEHPRMLLGRVGGLPGERVYLDSGTLHIDGEPVKEPASLARRQYASGDGVGPFGRSRGKEYSLVPAGHVFILTESDDPGAHWDSRTIGWIPQGDVVGTATATWWPPSRWGRLR